MQQATFAGLNFDAKKKRTRRERFLAEMDAVVPWTRLLALIEQIVALSFKTPICSEVP